jgi:hypothetical protein
MNGNLELQRTFKHPKHLEFLVYLRADIMKFNLWLRFGCQVYIELG